MHTRLAARISNVLLLIGLVALALSGCGSDSSTSGSTSSSAASTASTTATNQGEGSKEFYARGAENIVIKVGHEGDVAEREQASKIIEESFNAREALDWAGQCATLSAGGIKKVEEGSQTKGKKSCAVTLAPIGEAAPEAVLENNMAAPVGALRVNGTKGFAFYHGTDEIDWIVPLEKEDGEWKVAALSAELVPGSE